MISLQNRTRRMLTLHVPELGQREHTINTIHRSKDGATGEKQVVQVLPETLTLCAEGTPGDSADGLPDAVATSPEVLAAKARGELAIVEVAAPAPPPAPEPPPAPAPAEQAPAPKLAGKKKDAADAAPKE